MEIFICGANDVPDVIARTPIDAILSIEHPGALEGKGRAPRIEDPKINQLILCFWDIEEQGKQDYPSPDLVNTALEFLSKHQDDRVLIHCKAGKARNTALALTWMAYETGDIPKALQEIKQRRPEAAPNLAVIEIADEILGFKGRLLQAVSADEDFTEKRLRANERRQQQIAAGIFHEDPEKAGIITLPRNEFGS